MKSPAKKTRDAADLLAVAGVKNAELVAITVYGSSSILIHLTPRGFVRVVAHFGVARSKVKFDDVGEDGSLHAEFKARGADWTCFVRADSQEMRALRKALADNADQQLAGTRRGLIAAPTPRMLFDATKGESR